MPHSLDVRHLSYLLVKNFPFLLLTAYLCQIQAMSGNTCLEVISLRRHSEHGERCCGIQVRVGTTVSNGGIPETGCWNWKKHRQQCTPTNTRCNWSQTHQIRSKNALPRKWAKTTSWIKTFKMVMKAQKILNSCILSLPNFGTQKNFHCSSKHQHVHTSDYFTGSFS